MTGALLLFTPSNTVNYCTITITISYSVKIHIVLRRFKKYVQKVKKSSKNFQIYRYKTLSAKKKEKKVYLKKEKKTLNAMQFKETAYNSYDTARNDKKQHDTITVRYVTVRYDTMWYGTIPWYVTNDTVKSQRLKHLLEKSGPTIYVHYHIEYKKKQNITKKQRIENILERRR